MNRLRLTVQRAMQIEHPSVARVLELSDIHGVQIMVSEFVEGESLSDTKGKMDTAFTEERAVAIIQSLAAALDAADSASLVHGHIRPSNVLLTADGGVKLLDLGLVRPAGIVELESAFYRSPEQQRREPLDIRADIFSLGRLAIYLASAVAPFDLDLNQDVRDLCPELSDHMAGIIRKMTEPDRLNRFNFPREVVAALKQPSHSALSDPPLWSLMPDKQNRFQRLLLRHCSPRQNLTLLHWTKMKRRL